MNHRHIWMPTASAIAALLLLIGFYVVVSDATRQAHVARQEAISVNVKQAVCGMRSASSRDLCLLTMAAPMTATANTANVVERIVHTPSSSTSNIRVALGGITPPAPRAP